MNSPPCSVWSNQPLSLVRPWRVCLRRVLRGALLTTTKTAVLARSLCCSARKPKTINNHNQFVEQTSKCTHTHTNNTHRIDGKLIVDPMKKTIFSLQTATNYLRCLPAHRQRPPLAQSPPSSWEVDKFCQHTKGYIRSYSLIVTFSLFYWVMRFFHKKWGKIKGVFLA